MLDEVPPGPGHVSEVQYLFKLFLVWVSVFHFTLGLVRMNGALIQLLPLKLMLDSHSGICGATPFFALGILSAALLAMREREIPFRRRVGRRRRRIFYRSPTDRPLYCFHDFRPPQHVLRTLYRNIMVHTAGKSAFYPLI